MSKSTPGPWKAYDSSERCPLPAGPPVEVGTVAAGGGRLGTICEMNGQGDGKYESDVTWANARLIAAAPDFALVAVWREMDYETRSMACERNPDFARRVGEATVRLKPIMHAQVEALLTAGEGR